MAYVTTPGGTQHLPETIDDLAGYNDDDIEETHPYSGQVTPAEEDPPRMGGAATSSPTPRTRGTMGGSSRFPGRSPPTASGSRTLGKLPSVEEAERQRASIQEELERERSWRKLQEDQAELKALRRQRQAFKAGEVTDEMFLTTATALRVGVVLLRNSSFLPRPKPPQKFLGKT
jgi:hypothetical protein